VNIPIIQARNYTPANRSQVDFIILHTMETPETSGRAISVAQWFAGPDAPQASAHYMVDADQVVQSVDEKDIAWQVQSTNDVGNNRGIGIEHAGYAAWTPQDWSTPDAEAELKLSAQLTADIAKRWNIPLVWLDEAALQRGERGFTGHAQITNAFNHGVGHTDPGPNFPVDHYLALVKSASIAWGRIAVYTLGGLALGGFAWYLYENRRYFPIPQLTPRRLPARRHA
jgi:N-acetyl-anhydromuramyl-L-alanine amidase AmpD